MFVFSIFHAFLWDCSYPHLEKKAIQLTGGSWVRGVAFSPDGTKVVTAGYSDKNAKIWDATTGAELLTITGHTASVFA